MQDLVHIQDGNSLILSPLKETRFLDKEQIITEDVPKTRMAYDVSVLLQIPRFLQKMRVDVENMGRRTIRTTLLHVEDFKQLGNFARSQRSDLGKLLFNELAARLMDSLTAIIWQLP